MSVPPCAQSPSGLETVMYCYGLGAALQARTVDPNRTQTPKEDLLAAWPHEELSQLNDANLRMDVARCAWEHYSWCCRDTRELYYGLDAYQQHYMSLEGSDQHSDPILLRAWNESFHRPSRQGLVPDLVADISDITTPVMLLPIRIRIGGSWRDAPIKTVLLVDMRQQDWLPKDQSLDLAYKCRATLERHGILGVEVEVRAIPSSSWEAHRRSMSSLGSTSDDTIPGGQPRHAVESLQELRRARLAHLTNYTTRRGQSTLAWRLARSAKGPLESPDLQLLLKEVGTTGIQISSRHTYSTMGLILRLQGTEDYPERIVGLTCNHLIEQSYHHSKRPTILDSNLQSDSRANGLQDNESEEKGSQDIYLSHPQHLSRIGGAFDSAMKEIRGDIDEVTQIYEKHAITAEEKLSDLQKQKEALIELNAIRDMVPQDCPRIGEIFTSSTNGTITEDYKGRISPPTGHLFNWALIDIEPRYYTPTAAELLESPWLAWQNRLNAPDWRFLPRLRPDFESRAAADPQYWRNSPIRNPRGRDQDDDFLKISRVANTSQSRGSFRVAKHGAVTGFTVGHTVGAQAVFQWLKPGMSSEYAWSTQLVVVGEKDETAFSRPGDSGSAVINEDGEVVGMLMRGVVPAEPAAEEEDEDSYTKDHRMVKQRLDELINEALPDSVLRWYYNRLHEYRDRGLAFVTPIEHILEDIHHVTKQRAEIA